MKYEKIAKYSNTKFRRITGVKRATFDKMVEILQKGYAEKHRRRGRKPKLSIEDLLLATLEYLREYRTYAHIAASYGIAVSSQVKWAKFRHKVYQCRGEVSPGSIPAEKLVSNGLVVLQSVAGAGHVNNLAAVDEAVEDSGGNGSVAKEVGPLVKPLVGSNDQ